MCVETTVYSQFVGHNYILLCRRPGLDPWVGKIPWKREILHYFHSSILHSLHGWWSLVGYNPRGRKELDTTEQLHFTSLHTYSTPVFWPGEFPGLYSPWGHKESDRTECLSLSSYCQIKLSNFIIQFASICTSFFKLISDWGVFRGSYCDLWLWMDSFLLNFQFIYFVILLGCFSFTCCFVSLHAL